MANERDAARKAAETVKVGEGTVSVAAADQSRDAIETLRETVSAGAKTGRDAADEGRKTVERGAAAMRDVAGTVAETTTRAGEDAAQRFGQFFSASARASEEVAQRTQQTVDVLVQTGSVVGEGMQGILREWVNYTQGAMQRQVDAFNDILKVRSVQDLMAIQTDRVRREMELLLDTSARISEQAAKVSSDAYGRLHDQAERVRADRRVA